jgi:ligand-binding SRPBCC domain-containing protein
MGGTVVEDRVSYALWGGWFVNIFVVRPNLDLLFGYRQSRLKERFGAT